MDSEKSLRLISLVLAVCGVAFTVAALVTDLKVFWTIGLGSLGAGIALFVLFVKNQA